MPLPAKPTQFDAIRLVVLRALAEVETSLPARITSYDHTTQKASVQPLIRGVQVLPDQTREEIDLPEIPNCPVAFPAGGNASLTFPLSVGDRVTVVFCSRDIAGWLSNDSEANTPQDPRRHSFDDAIVIPGARSFKSPLGAAALDASDTVLAADGIMLGSSTAIDYVTLASKIAAEINANLVAIFNAHTHPVSGAATGPPTTPQTNILADNIRSQKVRSE